MTQSKVYVDTNVYLRLAQSVHPLLFNSFCPEEYTLYITHRFQKEYSRQPRLKSKFYWVNDKQYLQNRKQKIFISKEQGEDIKLACGYIADHNFALSLGVKDVDVDILAHAFVVGLPVATDDHDMTTLGRAFNIEIWGSLDLMRKMLDCGHVSIDELDAAVGYMDHMMDLPWPRYKADYAKFFPSSKFNKK